MAQKINIADTGTFSLERSGDVFSGIVGGKNFITINEEKTRKNIEEHPILEDGEYIKDITSDNSTDEQPQAYLNMLGDIKEKHTVINAFFQPKITSATLSVQDGSQFRNFKLYLTNANNSNNQSSSVVTMFEEIKQPDETIKLQEVNIPATRVTLREMNFAINDVLQGAMKANLEQGSKDALAMFIAETSKYEDKSLWVKDDDGNSSLNIIPENLTALTNIAQKIIALSLQDPSIPLKLNDGDKTTAILNKFKAHPVESIIFMSATNIANNKDDLQEKLGISVISTKVESYEILAADKDLELSAKYSNFPTLKDDKLIDKIRTEYISQEVRADMKAFVEKAQKDIFAAGHLFSAVAKEVKPSMFKLHDITIKEKPSEEDKRAAISLSQDIVNKLKPLSNKFPSISFYGDSLFSTQVLQQKTPDKLLKSANNFLYAMEKAIKTVLEFNQNIAQIGLTKDGDRVLNKSKINPGFEYTGRVPSGYANVVFGTPTAKISGRIDSDTLLNIKATILPEKIVFSEKSFTTKDGEELKVPARAFFPRPQSGLDPSLYEVFNRIDRMDNEGNIYYEGSDKGYPAKVKEAIEFLTVKAYGDGTEKNKGEITNKSNLKVAPFYKALIKKLTDLQNSPTELKNFLENIKNGNEIKGLPRALQVNLNVLRVAIELSKHTDNGSNFRQSVSSYHNKLINESLKRSLETGTLCFLKQADHPETSQNVIREVNKSLGEIYDMNQAMVKTAEQVRNKLEEHKEKNPEQKVFSPLYDRLIPTVSSSLMTEITQDDKKYQVLASPNAFYDNNLGSTKISKRRADGETTELVVPMPSDISKALARVLNNKNYEAEIGINPRESFAQNQKDAREVRVANFINNAGMNKPKLTLEAMNEMLAAAKQQNFEEMAGTIITPNIPVTDEPAKAPSVSTKAKAKTKAPIVTEDIPKDAVLIDEVEVPKNEDISLTSAFGIGDLDDWEYKLNDDTDMGNGFDFDIDENDFNNQEEIKLDDPDEDQEQVSRPKI